MFGLFSHLSPKGRALASDAIGKVLGLIEEVGRSFTYVTASASENPHISITCEGRSFRIDSSKVIDEEELNVARIEGRQFLAGNTTEMEVWVKTLQLLAGRRS